MAEVETWLISIAGNWWIHLVTFSFCLLDAFFPVVPSETTLVTLSSLYAATAVPNPFLLFLAGFSGAFIGDHIAYLLGKKVGWERFKFMHSARGIKALATAKHGLEKRALIYFLTSRFIPLGRTAVNFTAGALNYPLKAYTPRVLISTFIWALYSVLIGVVAGQWFKNNALLGIVVALILAVVLSWLIEKAIQRLLPKPKILISPAAEIRAIKENAKELGAAEAADSAAEAADSAAEAADSAASADSAAEAAPKSRQDEAR